MIQPVHSLSGHARKLDFYFLDSGFVQVAVDNDSTCVLAGNDSVSLSNFELPLGRDGKSRRSATYERHNGSAISETTTESLVGT